MEKELKLGLMVQGTMECTSTAKNMAEDDLNLSIGNVAFTIFLYYSLQFVLFHIRRIINQIYLVLCTMVSSDIMKSAGEEYTSGVMEKLMMESGWLIKCMATASSSGPTLSDMKESLQMIKDMAWENLGGEMVKSMMDLGKREDSMELESL